ncbi:MAG: WD40 repeat domain-containing protein [Planctomycetes bacterium]|nr:WD40 repeat domain-containing protein [Planctomycetota bacterium]
MPHVIALLAAAALAAPQEPIPAASPSLAHEAYRAQMAAAEASILLGELAEARAWLDATEPARRGFEWRLFDAEFDDSLARYDVESPVLSLALAPDGSALALGREDGVLELRDAQGFALLAHDKVHGAGITQIRWDRSGKRLVSCSYDRRVVISSAPRLELELEFTQHGFPVGGADFSPDGTLVASCSYERPEGSVVGTVHLWNSADGSIVRTLHGGRKPLVGLAFSPDGTQIAAGSWDFCAFVWSVEGGEPRKLAIPDEGRYNAVDGVAWSPDGALLAAASKDHSARVFRVASGELLQTLRGHGDAIAKLAFSPDGSLLATAAADGTLALHDPVKGQRLAVLRGHADDVLAVAFAPDGATLWSASSDRTLRRFDARPATYARAPLATSHATYVVRWSPIDDRIASASYDGRITLWSSVTREPLASWQAHPSDKSCHALTWSPDGRVLTSASWDGTVGIWNALTGAELGRLVHEKGISWLALSRDGALLAVATDVEVHVWDVAQRERVQVFRGHSAGVLSVSFAPDGARCVSCARDGKAHVWNTRSAEILATCTGVGSDVASAAFLPNGAQVVVGGRGGIVARFDATSGKLVRELVRNRHGFDHLELSPDGTRLVLASESVVFVDVANGGIVGRFRSHRDRPHHIAFDRTGEILASCSADKSLAILDPRPLRVRLAARERRAAQRAQLLASIEKPLAEGASFESIASSVYANHELDAETRAAWLEALTLASAR